MKTTLWSSYYHSQFRLRNQELLCHGLYLSSILYLVLSLLVGLWQLVCGRLKIRTWVYWITKPIFTILDCLVHIHWMGKYVEFAKLGSKFEMEWDYSLNTKTFHVLSVDNNQRSKTYEAYKLSFCSGGFLSRLLDTYPSKQ